MTYEFNKLLKSVNDSLPPICTVRYEDKDLSLYNIEWASERPEYKRAFIIESGTKPRITLVLHGMLTYAKVLNGYMEQKMGEEKVVEDENKD